MALHVPGLRLAPLEERHAEDYYVLYSDPAVNGGESAFLEAETPSGFLTRIRSLCTVLYGIFIDDALIGDCALHHWDPVAGSIEIGGALLPAYQRRGIMRDAFVSLGNQARALGAKRIIGRTSPGNAAAIRLVELLGYRKTGLADGELVLELELPPL